MTISFLKTFRIFAVAKSGEIGLDRESAFSLCSSLVNLDNLL